jgi:hypothetical protein
MTETTVRKRTRREGKQLLFLLPVLQHASLSCAGLKISSSNIPLYTRTPSTGRVYLPLSLLFLLALGQIKKPLHPRQRDTPLEEMLLDALAAVPV